MFQNIKIGTLTREKYSYYYDNNIESKWTPIEPIIKSWEIPIIYHNKDSISNSTCNSKNHPLFEQGLSLKGASMVKGPTPNSFLQRTLIRNGFYNTTWHITIA
jgi:hypothetical protein